MRVESSLDFALLDWGEWELWSGQLVEKQRLVRVRRGDLGISGGRWAYQSQKGLRQERQAQWWEA